MSLNVPNPSEPRDEEKSRQMIINDLPDPHRDRANSTIPSNTDANETAPYPKRGQTPSNFRGSDPFSDSTVPSHAEIMSDLLNSSETEPAPVKERHNDLQCPPKEWIINDLDEPEHEEPEDDIPQQPFPAGPQLVINDLDPPAPSQTIIVSEQENQPNESLPQQSEWPEIAEKLAALENPPQVDIAAQNFPGIVNDLPNEESSRHTPCAVAADGTRSVPATFRTNWPPAEMETGPQPNYTIPEQPPAPCEEVADLSGTPATEQSELSSDEAKPLTAGPLSINYPLPPLPDLAGHTVNKFHAELSASAQEENQPESHEDQPDPEPEQSKNTPEQPRDPSFPKLFENNLRNEEGDNDDNNPAKSPPASDSASLHARMDDEMDLWWGSYSSWGLLPTWLVCLLLTAICFVVLEMILGREYRQLTIVGLVGSIWLVQLTRWLYRYFGYTYRLTTRRLYVNRGWLYSDANRIDLTEIKQLRADFSWWGKIIDVGCILVERNDKQPPLVLDAVRNPQRVLKHLENSIKLAKEHQERKQQA